MIIAIDGPAASGKGTIAIKIASMYGLHHLDSGLLYRAVAKAVLDAGYATSDAAHATEIAARLDPSKFEENALKSQAITEAAGRGARRPRHRHGDSAGGGRQTFCRRLARSARRPPRERIARARRGHRRARGTRRPVAAGRA